MPLLNLAWKTTPFFWDGRSPTLRDQILKPIEDPLEMGETLPNVITKLEGISYYPRLFEEARVIGCLLYTSPSPRDQRGARMPSSA